MKKILLFLGLFFPFYISAQLGTSLRFEGVLGCRLNLLPQQDRPGRPNFLVTSPLAGLKISHQQYPFSLSFMHDRSYFIRQYPVNDLYDIQEINKGNMLRIQYEGQKFRYGLGHYWYRQEGLIDYIFPDGAVPIRYIAFTFAVPFGRAEVEFQSLMRYTIFDVGDRYLQELNFKYYFGGQKNKEQKYITQLVSLNFSLGGRWFLPNQPYLGGETKAKVGTAAAIGIEILADKYRTGAYWQKDWWIALNGGSPTREVKGQITNNVFGLRYHHPLKNNKSFNLGLGYAWIMDISTLSDTRKKIVKGEEPEKLWTNNIQGISISPSYNFNKHLEIELRQIIATEGEHGLALERLSLGVFYKIRP